MITFTINLKNTLGLERVWNFTLCTIQCFRFNDLFFNVDNSTQIKEILLLMDLQFST
jgi:hypothetical protein